MTSEQNVLELRSADLNDRAWLKGLIAEHWGDSIVVSLGRVHRPHQLRGFIATRQGQKLGAATFSIERGECELVTLNALTPRSGIGTMLLGAVVEAAAQEKCSRVWLVTTNDNLPALHFYQRRGFELVAVHRRSIAASRALKPSIPMIGIDGIPIRDEVELEKVLGTVLQE